MSYATVCISRDAGADGELVGRLVADALGYRYLDEEIVARAAERGALDMVTVAGAETRPSLRQRLTDALAEGAASAPEAVAFSGVLDPGYRDPGDRVRGLIRDAIAEMAAAGEVVIVAHAASYTLGRDAGALRVLALVSLRSGSGEEALATADAAIAAARAAADDWEEGLALAVRAAIIARQGRLNEAQRAFEAALDVLHDNNGWGVAQTLYGFGALARARGDHAAALRHFGQALALYREIDARPEIARCLAGIGRVALAQQDLPLARSSLTECLQLSLATGQRLAIARCLEAFALLTAAQGGEPATAGKLQGAALALREAIGVVRSSPAGTPLSQLLDSARGPLGEAAAAALLQEGRAMTGYEAARLAIGADGEPAGDRPPAGDRAPAGQLPLLGQAPDGSGSGAPSLLTVRELEIAALIARGLSNRGIADELVISPATAARHVANIFTKLGFSSRAQVAAWVVERGSASRD